MSDDYQTPTPGSKTWSKVQENNDQGQGSAFKGSSKMFQPKVKLEEWPPDSRSKAPGDAA
jgi:hypothetical protein